jgi:transposase
LLALTKRGKVAARRLTRAYLLLQAHAGLADEAIAQALPIGTAPVERIRKRFVEEGLAVALAERPRPGGQRQLDDKQEAFRIALACSTPPEGRTCWTMQLPAEKLVELQVIEAISDETVRRTRKKTASSRGRRRPGVFPA